MILVEPLVDDVRELRPLDVVDVTQNYLSWLNDPEITRYLEVRFAAPATLESLQEFVQNTRKSPNDLMLGIFLRESGQHVGNIKLGPINSQHGTAEIGLLIGDRAEWGKGHAAAAISLISAYAFTVLGLSKLTAGCYAPNVGSTKAFLKAGFVQEGTRFSQWKTDDGRCDGVLLGKLNPAEL